MSSSSSSAFTLPDDPLEDLFPGESAISIDPTRAPLYIPQRKAQGFARKPRARAPLPTTPSSSVMSDSPKIKITAWRPFQKNTLLGFVTVEFPFGLIIRDITVHTKNGKTWIGLPAKPQLGDDGKQRRDTNGKALYSAVLEFRDRDIHDRFSSTVIHLLGQAHPGATG